MPIITGIIVKNKNIDFDTTDIFLVDSGAAISLLNSKYSSFFSDSEIIGYQSVQYGTGPKKKLPLYNVGIKVQGHYFDLIAAIDNDLPYLLIGNYSFLDQFDNVIMCPKTQMTVFTKEGKRNV